MDFTLNLLIIIADQLMLFGINLIVARRAGEYLFGDFTVATNGLLLISTVLTLGIDSIIGYYVPKLHAQKKYKEIIGLTNGIKSFLKPIYYMVFLGGSLLMLMLIGVSHAIDRLNLFDISHPLYLFLWGTVVISTYNIYLQFFRAMDYMRMAVLMSLLQTVCYFLLSLSIYLYFYPTLFHHDARYFPHMMLVGFILSYMIIVVISIAIRRKSVIKNNATVVPISPWQWKNKIYGYTLQNLNRYIFAVIPLLILKWLGHNEYSVGLFSAVSSIISLAFIAISPIGILIGPEISAAFTKNKEALKQVMKKYLFICFAISLVVMSILGFFAKEILLLYKSNFIDALPYTYACLINIVIFGISMPLTRMIQYSYHGSDIGAKLTIYILVFQLVACEILIHRFGLLGAVICYVGINVIYNAIMIVMALRIYRHETFGSQAI